MKNLFTNLIVFAVLSLAISNLTGCSAPTSNATNGPANSGSPANTQTTNNPNSADYPPLASGLAEANFEMLDGTKFKVSERKGKVLLLNLWGTWCIPCRAEMPHLIELQNMYGERGLEVIGLNIGDGDGGQESNEDIEEFVRKVKLNYTIARSPREATKQFYLITKAEVVPQSLVVDREGRLRGAFIGGGGDVINKMKDIVGRVMNE